MKKLLLFALVILAVAVNAQSRHPYDCDFKYGFFSNWNIYAAEVYRDSICTYINGEKTMTYPKVEGKEHQFPWPDYPFYFILSNQLGGAWVGEVKNPDQLPSELKVDWIKVNQWQ